MLKELPLRTKLVVYGIALSIIPLLIIATTTFFQSNYCFAEIYGRRPVARKKFKHAQTIANRR